jgi:ferric-dicitrate binding protein FerR (iron transport regulator)
MKKTNYYTTLDDFLSDEFFELWTKLQENKEDFDKWTSQNPELAKRAQEARFFQSAMTVKEVVLSPEEIKNGLENTWGKIEVKQKKDRKTSSLVLRIKKQYRRIASVAAIFILGLTAVWFYTNTYKNSDVIHQTLVGGHEQEIVDYTNSSNKNQILTLSDGSSVLLKPNSTLRYPKLFIGKNRIVHLVGEGFFEISKNPKRPFLVYANEIVTKVVGTSFRIKAYSDNQEVSVTVRTGKVEVQSNKLNENSTKKGVVLLPNQGVSFMRNKLTFDKITDLSKEKTILDNKENIEQFRFDFTDVAVSEIFKTMEQAYSISIDFPLEKLKNCHLTTDLNDQPLPEKLKIICNSISKNTHYKIIENQVVINSDGCN